MTKQIENLTDAISEAHRFIKAATAAKRRLKNDKWVGFCGSKETGAAKRASMDLSRTLTKIRQP